MPRKMQDRELKPVVTGRELIAWIQERHLEDEPVTVSQPHLCEAGFLHDVTGMSWTETGGTALDVRKTDKRIVRE